MGTATFASLHEFYSQIHTSAITEVRSAGRNGASLINAIQGAGDWSDAATPDLAIGIPVSKHAAATLDMGGGRFRVQGFIPNSFVISPPQFATTVLVDGRHSVRVLAAPYQALLDLTGDGSGLPPDGDFGPLHKSFTRSPQVVGLINKLWDECALGSPFGGLWADGAIVQLLALLLRESQRSSESHSGGLAPWQLRLAFEMMSQHLDRDVPLAVVAKATGLSTAHFCRAFKASVGIPPYRWLVEHRISIAKELMASKHLTLTEVSQSVGFSGQAAFGVAFKRVTGVTPSTYRRGILD